MSDLVGTQIVGFLTHRLIKEVEDATGEMINTEKKRGGGDGGGTSSSSPSWS